MIERHREAFKPTGSFDLVGLALPPSFIRSETGVHALICACCDELDLAWQQRRISFQLLINRCSSASIT